MKIVIDAHRVIAALLKDSTTRGIIFLPHFSYIAPDFIMQEIRKYDVDLRKKAHITHEEFEILFTLLFENITIIPKETYKAQLTKLSQHMRDPKDIPYIAVCIHQKAEGIWTHDPHFHEQKHVNIFTNMDLLDIMRST